MKQLILGIDGGDLRIFRAFKMPFLHSLIEENYSIELNEDLVNRGWAETISGEYGRDNKAIYIMPKLNSTYDFSLSYSFQDLKNNSSKPLIWEVAENKGMKVGVMNIPTTYPAPKEVNGFFVSGAGGGLYKVDGIPEDMCNDKDVQQYLSDKEYELELRFKPSGINEAETFFSRTNKMMKKRFSAFIELSKKKECDFGFLALRGTANIQYVVMYHIEKFINGEKISKKWEKFLCDHFSLLDKLIQQLFTELSPENFIITSDHGTAPQEYHANYNVFLEREGYLKRVKANPLIGKVKSFGKMILNTLGYRYLDVVAGKINWKETQVFGAWYSNSLFINDSERFNGPIDSSEKISQLVDDVCSSINNSPEASKYQLKAAPYRRNFEDSNFNEFLPDIFIDAPDNIFFYHGDSKNFIAKSAWFKNFDTLKNIPSSMFTGTKGRNPICILNKGLLDLIQKEDTKDLTLVYHLTKRYFDTIK